MGDINGIEGLAKVPVDYFANIPAADAANGVGAAGAANGPQAAGGEVEEAGRADADEGAKVSDSIVRQLDVIMINAAKASVNTVAAGALKALSPQLVELGILDEKNALALEELARTAKAKTRALDALTGRQLANAIKVGGSGTVSWKKGFWGMTAEAKLVKEAVEAQRELGDAITKIVQALGRHPDASAQLYNHFAELRLQCDRRETEVHSLLLEMHDFAQRSRPSREMKALLAATFKDLVPRQALSMHGTADALGAVNAELRSKLAPLADTLKTLAENPKAEYSEEQLLAIERDIATMKNAIADARVDGIKIDAKNAPGDGKEAKEERIVPDRLLLLTVEKHLAAVSDALKHVKSQMLKRLQEKFIAEAKQFLVYYDNSAERRVYTDPANPETKKFTDCCRDIIAAMTRFKDAKNDQERLAAANDIDKVLADIDTLDLAEIKSEVGGTSKLVRAVNNLREFKWACEQFLSLERNIAGMKRGETVLGEGLHSLFDGKIKVSALVEARARGFADADVDPETDPSNIVSSKPLGSGAAGSAYVVETVDGKKFVFKAETESSLGLRWLKAGSGGVYSSKQTTANLDIATGLAAKHLGVGDLVVKTTVGVHKGKFGVFMEMAPGMSAGDYASGGGRAPEGCMAAGETRRLATAGRSAVTGRIMSKLNQLQWLDLVTGQLDRHWGNYFIKVESGTRKVTVKGIDNDASFSSIKTGLTKFRVPAKRVAKFKAAVANAAFKLYGPSKVQAEYNKLLADPSIVHNQDGSVEIDASKIANPELHAVLAEELGTKTSVLPDRMDKSIYDSLTAMKNDPAKRQAYLDDIRPRLSGAGYAAAVQRLDEAIETAEKYRKWGLVVDETYWETPGARLHAPKLDDSMIVHTADHKEKRFMRGDNRLVNECNFGTCQSYYTRDLLDTKF